TGSVFRSGTKIDVVVTGDAADARRQGFPERDFRIAMTRVAVAVFLRDRLGRYRLRRDDRGEIDDALVNTDGEVGLALFDAGQILSPVELMDEEFEVEIFAGLGIGELRGMAE